MIFFLIVGVFEICSNLIHLTRGSIDKIGQSARKQHGELPPDLDMKHYVIKAILMFILGILYLVIGIILLLGNSNRVLIITGLAIMGFYGFIQALIYKKPFRIWMGAVVHNIPLAFFLLK